MFVVSIEEEATSKRQDEDEAKMMVVRRVVGEFMAMRGDGW